MDLDLELYRVFCEVVKHKNISKTAESMYISQSAITQSIQKLENLLGGKVFYRNKNGVELTEEGKNLYEYIKDSIETMNNAEKIFSKYLDLEKGSIRIGGGDALVSSLIMNPVLEFMKKYPNINISISNGTTDNMMQKLANGELDIVVLNLPFNAKNYSNVEIKPLKKSSYVFFASEKYVKEHNVKNLNKANDCNFIFPKLSSSRKKILDKCIEIEKLEIEPRYEMSSTLITKEMVLNDVGIGFTNYQNIEDIADKVKVIKEINIDELEEGIACLKPNMASKATLELVREINAYYSGK